MWYNIITAKELRIMRRENDNYSCARLCNAYNARAERDEKEIRELRKQIKELKKQIEELKKRGN